MMLVCFLLVRAWFFENTDIYHYSGNVQDSLGNATSASNTNMHPRFFLQMQRNSA